MSLISGLLNQTVTSISSVSKDAYGDDTKTVLHSNVACRWEDKIVKLVTNNNNNVRDNADIVEARSEMWVENDISIDYNYVVVKDSKNYIIIEYKEGIDLSGKHDYTKVWLV